MQTSRATTICFLYLLADIGHCGNIIQTNWWQIHWNLKPFDWELISVVGGGHWEYGRRHRGGLAILLLIYDCLFINALIAQSPKKDIFLVFLIHGTTRIFFHYSCSLINYFWVSKGDRLVNEWDVGEPDLLWWLRIWSKVYFAWDVGLLSSTAL